MLGGIQEFHTYRETRVIVADDDAAFLFHGVCRWLFSQLDEQYVSIPIITDNHGCSLQYRFIRLVQ